jgi:hypothetical protein
MKPTHYIVFNEDGNAIGVIINDEDADNRLNTLVNQHYDSEMVLKFLEVTNDGFRYSISNADYEEVIRLESTWVY